jgi:HlyD family secretion protein
MKASSNRIAPARLDLLGVLLIAAMAYVVMRSGPLAPTRVTVVQASRGQPVAALFGIGTVEARRSLPDRADRGRPRAAVLVDVGDTVKAGQLLAEMDPVDLDERPPRWTPRSHAPAAPSPPPRRSA